MATTTFKKKPRCPHHNFVKTKALYYLSRCRELVTSADIAKSINANPGSIYVLLNRWTRWGYIKRYDGYDNEVRRFLYSLAPKGRIYLENLDIWYLYKKQAIDEVNLLLYMRSWVFGRIPGRDGKNRYHIIQFPYDNPNRDYFVLDELPGGDYYRNVTSLPDLFKYAREYKKHEINYSFKQSVTAAITAALNESKPASSAR